MLVSRFWTRSLAGAAALLSGIAAAVAASAIAPKAGGFTVTFPVAPEQKTVDTKGDDPVTGEVWSAGANGVVYFVDYVDYTHAIDAEGELAANAKNFAASFKGHVTSGRKRSFKRSGETLPGLRFTFEGPTVAGIGVTAVAGRRSYVAAAVSVKPHDGRAEIESFLKSFRLTAIVP